MSLKDAYEYVVDRRPSSLPRAEFLLQLGARMARGHDETTNHQPSTVTHAEEMEIRARGESSLEAIEDEFHKKRVTFALAERYKKMTCVQRRAARPRRPARPPPDGFMRRFPLILRSTQSGDSATFAAENKGQPQRAAQEGPPQGSGGGGGDESASLITTRRRRAPMPAAPQEEQPAEPEVETAVADQQSDADGADGGDGEERTGSVSGRSRLLSLTPAPVHRTRATTRIGPAR
jgi:hypothetical protein